MGMPEPRVISVRDAMVAEVLVAGPDENVAQAAKLMSERGVGSIIVVKNGVPIGIITERDVLTKVVALNLVPARVRIGRVMSSPLITVAPDADVTDAARLMAAHNIRRLPVVERGVMVGVITAADVAHLSPTITEMLTRRPELLPEREEPIEASVCEECSAASDEVFEVEGRWVCRSCRDALSA